MKIFNKYFILFLGLSLFITVKAQENQPLIGKDGPPDMFLKSPSESDMTMRLLSFDNKNHIYYLKNGNLYAPVKFSANRDLRTSYSYPKSEIVDFYRRDQKDDTIYFTRVFSINSKGSSDIIGGLLQMPNGEFRTMAADISLDAIPLGSFCAINMSPFPLGLTVDKKTSKVTKIFDSVHGEGKLQGGVRIAQLDIYDLRSGKPVHLSSRRHNYLGNKRFISMIFEMPRPPVMINEGEEAPAANDTWEMYDSGPRS